jgi:hypothetical protein
MPKYTLSGPGGQDADIEAPNLFEAGEAAKRFAQRYGILDEVDVYGEGQTEPLATLPIEDDRPIYMFVYCAAEQGSLSRRCDDDNAARKHGHLLADGHGENCHVFRYKGQTVGEGSKLYSVGAPIPPRIPKS